MRGSGVAGSPKPSRREGSAVGAGSPRGRSVAEIGSCSMVTTTSPTPAPASTRGARLDPRTTRVRVAPLDGAERTRQAHAGQPPTRDLGRWSPHRRARRIAARPAGAGVHVRARPKRRPEAPSRRSARTVVRRRVSTAERQSSARSKIRENSSRAHLAPWPLDGHSARAPSRRSHARGISSSARSGGLRATPGAETARKWP